MRVNRLRYALFSSQKNYCTIYHLRLFVHQAAVLQDFDQIIFPMTSLSLFLKLESSGIQTGIVCMQTALPKSSSPSCQTPSHFAILLVLLDPRGYSKQCSSGRILTKVASPFPHSLGVEKKKIQPFVNYPMPCSFLSLFQHNHRFEISDFTPLSSP